MSLSAKIFKNHERIERNSILLLVLTLITVSIGPLIPAAGRDADEVIAEVEGWIESEMRRLSPHLYAGNSKPARAGDSRTS